LSKANQLRPNLHFQAVNALEWDSLLAAAAAFVLDRPLAVITEGLLPYLDRGEREVIAMNIHTLLDTYERIWITSDVSSRQTWSAIALTNTQSATNMRERLRLISERTQRNIEENAFANDAEIQQFFTQAGFKIEEYLQSNIFYELSSIKRLEYTRAEIEPILVKQKTFILMART
jgi:O-methyltransferase involved in polyketide biosynthesis